MKPTSGVFDLADALAKRVILYTAAGTALLGAVVALKGWYVVALPAIGLLATIVVGIRARSGATRLQNPAYAFFIAPLLVFSMLAATAYAFKALQDVILDILDRMTAFAEAVAGGAPTTALVRNSEHYAQYIFGAGCFAAIALLLSQLLVAALLGAQMRLTERADSCMSSKAGQPIAPSATGEREHDTTE